MDSVRLATEAMATRFEFILIGANGNSLRAAGEEAIAEIHRLEAALSVYRADSEIAALNREAAARPVRVTPETFELLRHALLLSYATGGAFDVTIGPLLHAWGMMRGSGRVPSESELETARALIGPEMIGLNEVNRTVRFARFGVKVDLGSIGKGYALDRAVQLLQEAGVQHGLVHGGTSTTVAFGQPLDSETWKVAIDPPWVAGRSPDSPAPLAVVSLQDESLSVSAVWGKGFEADGKFFGHVMDPRFGRPVEGALLAAMVLPSATESDALSTALLVRGAEMLELLRKKGAPARCLVVEASSSLSGYRVVTNGISARVE